MVTSQVPTLLAVHAHPGEESTNTGGVLARYARGGVHTVLVTCTNGEFGDAEGGVGPGTPGHDPATVGRTRVTELEAACAHLGVHDLELLGYSDSGMPDWDLRHRPDVFCNVPVDTAADRLAGIVERYRPDVVLTYDPESPYRHPDQLHTAKVTERAVRLTGIPAKLYAVAMGTTYWRHVRDAVLAAGLPSPFPDPDLSPELARVERGVTTTVDVQAALPAKRAAVLAHRSQVGGTWIETLFRGPLPPALGAETYIRVHDTTGAPVPERDLFAGIAR
ncbi:N-acetylglucosaminyl deacetylase, LmbE family [Amycolatopsis arida]|uniref:N-acetylglucosaminyl deacetylase, LmbE family n=1 Tax=Amycolatopsis arida TaxID=587909 RepID=A0A1I6ARH3_9PSEU|nr:PIG-L family deacetylase [Amycolatopsis arida]TDX97587.1 LmbE family N-acetylglucosaminyl deacetylase [Amycolatopsis arida]SFQ71275.1 N-acetylglucosaminyl deacetylase, LmbE family [Amycolatopsis arida]